VNHRVVLVDDHVVIREALAAGATGYLVKTSGVDVLAQGVRDIAAGETVIGEEFVPRLLADAVRGPAPARTDMTDRERQVLALVAEGLGNREVGDQLGISSRTAQKHLENLFRKFDVHDRTELVTKAFRAGLIG
jgi:DNA-binding NarL/FixJ family response regulator